MIAELEINLQLDYRESFRQLLDLEPTKIAKMVSISGDKLQRGSFYQELVKRSRSDKLGLILDHTQYCLV